MSSLITGLQYGDEGKGKVCNALLKSNRFNMNIKLTGGPNAGHTVYINNNKIVLHQLPIGAVYEYMSIMIGPNCVVDIKKLEEEIKMVEEILNFSEDQKIKNRLYLCYNSHVIKKEHIEEDCRIDKVGSTKCGIRPVNRDKYDRVGTRICDLQLDNTWNVVDAYELLRNRYTILFEISQGFNLDIDYGNYPYITSSQCHIGTVSTCGFPIKNINNVYGIAKIYSTYVGNMEYQPKDDKYLEQLQILGEEYGATTSRQRQCNWLDLDELNKAIYINCVTDLIINKCDIIQKLNYYKLYHNNSDITFKSWNEMKEYIKRSIYGNINIIFSYRKDDI